MGSNSSPLGSFTTFKLPQCRRLEVSRVTLPVFIYINDAPEGRGDAPCSWVTRMCYSLDKGRCPAPWLSHTLRIFTRETFLSTAHRRRLQPSRCSGRYARCLKKKVFQCSIYKLHIKCNGGKLIFYFGGLCHILYSMPRTRFVAAASAPFYQPYNMYCYIICTVPL